MSALDFFRRREPLAPEDPGLASARRKAAEANARLEAVQKFKAQYPDFKITDQVQPRAQASTEGNTQGQMWGWGWPRGSGAKWPGGMSTPYAGISINHWQLRQQARDICFDVPAAKALVTRFADSTIGTGLKLEPSPKFDILGIDADAADAWAADVRERYSLWCKSRNQNRSRGMSWYQAQHLLQLTAERDNDEFVRLYYSQDPNLLNPLQFEVIDANMIRGDAFTVTNVIGRFPDGITRNADGSEKAYKIWAQHLSEDEYTYQFEQVDIPRVGEKSGRLFMLHAFSQEYAGQGRGFSGIGSIVQELELIEDAILATAKKFINQSNLNMFVKPSANNPASNPFEFMLQNAAGPASFALGIPGSAGDAIGGIPVTTNSVRYTPLKEATFSAGGVGVFNLAEGEDLVLPPNDAPAQFKEFIMTHLSIIAASKGMPLSLLIIAFNGSYSASRGELLVFEEILKMKRQDFDANLEGPLYEMWLSCEIAAGRVACPGWNDPLLRAAWTAHRLNGVPMPNIDPSQTADADKAYLQMGAQTPEDVARNFNGSSFQHNLARNKKAAPELPVWNFEKKFTDKGEDPSSPESATAAAPKKPAPGAP
jgi:capsid protein